MLETWSKSVPKSKFIAKKFLHESAKAVTEPDAVLEPAAAAGDDGPGLALGDVDETGLALVAAESSEPAESGPAANPKQERA